MRLVALLCAVLVVTLFQLGLADTPSTISYQGVLKDDVGNVVPDDDYEIVFTLYDGVTTGDIEWTEIQTVAVLDGLFSVILGSVEPMGLAFDEPYWLGIKVETEPELTPRVELTGVPYAFRAKYADVADDGDWVISGDDMYSGVSGNIGIGTTSPEWRLDVQKIGSSSSAPMIAVKGYADNTGGGSYIRLMKSRGTAVGENVATQDGDALGVIDGYGVNGGSTGVANAARIVFKQDGLAGEYFNPGRLEFRTSDGIIEPAARMVIKSDGKVGVGTTDPAYTLDVTGDVRATGAIYGTVDNADKVDSYHAGNASGEVAVSNGTTCVDLDADMLDGQHSTDFARRIVTTCPGGGSITFDIPQRAPCTVTVAEAEGSPDWDAVGFVHVVADDHHVSWTGIDGSGAIARGGSYLGYDTTIMTCASGNVALKTPNESEYKLKVTSAVRDARILVVW